MAGAFALDEGSIGPAVGAVWHSPDDCSPQPNASPPRLSRPVVAGDPGLTNVPFHHSSDDRAQCFAFFGQRIFEARWMFGVMRGCDDAGLDQPREPIAKAHQRQISPEIRSAGHK